MPPDSTPTPGPTVSATLSAAASTAPVTPLMRQYHEAKRQNPEALLLFRLGDFYELFFDDAVKAAPILQITLTSRNKERGQPIPMCGVPYHAAESYISRLIQQGFKVALCDQMEDPKLAKTPAKTIVRREVTRVLTPGTAGLQLSVGDNHWLAAVARPAMARNGAPGPVGLAWLDVSTGEFRATEFDGASADDRLRDELTRSTPRELLLAADAPLFREQHPEETLGASLTRLDAWMFEPAFTQGVLESHFGVLSLEGFGLLDRPWAAAAAGAIVHYVKETQRSPLAHVTRLGFYERQSGLVLDAVTTRNLELIEPLFQGQESATLRSVLDQTVTAMGKRLLRQWLLRPSGEASEINLRHEAVSELHGDWRARAALREEAAGIQDLERLLSRVALDTALPRDLVALQLSLDRIPALAGYLGGAVSARLRQLAAQLDPLDALRQAISTALVEQPPATLSDGGYIKAGVSPQLDELRSLTHDAKSAIAQIEQRERERTTIASLKVRFNGIFGYYIEVSKPNLRLVPHDYERKQTLVNAERFTTPELKEFERKILTAEEESQRIEAEIFRQLRQQATNSASAIRQNASSIAEADVLANFAHLASERAWQRPEMGGREIAVHQGRHPVVEHLAQGVPSGGASDRYVPNDLALSPDGQRILLVTGPNMGGKSTYLRQTALISILAQMGSFVPANSAKLPIFDRIFTRIGASDNLARGRSTFMVEMTEAAVILNQASERSLVILDEVGRGTSTYDGLALAWAMVEYLDTHNRAFTLFATHYHELTALASHLPSVANAHVEVRETPSGVVFLRTVAPGAASRSYGIEVARLAGLPRAVIERARQVLTQHERTEARATLALESPTPAPQLALFTPLTQSVLDQLRAAALDELTPLEALNLLAELQRQIGSE